MQHHHKDFLGVILFLILLFIAWVLIGGPKMAEESGSANNKYQDSLAPVGTGETYNNIDQKPVSTATVWP